MVSKCANPHCRAEFEYFSEGRIFEFTSKTSPLTKEFFWLCAECSQSISLRESERGVRVVPLQRDPSAIAPDGVGLQREWLIFPRRLKRNSCTGIDTLWPTKVTPSACNRSRCSTAASPRKQILPFDPTTRYQGKPGELCSAQDACRAAPRNPAALAISP